MNVKDLLQMCATNYNDRYPALQCVNLVHVKGTGRFPFRGSGVELLNDTGKQRVYSVDIEVILLAVAKDVRRHRQETKP